MLYVLPPPSAPSPPSPWATIPTSKRRDTRNPWLAVQARARAAANPNRRPPRPRATYRKDCGSAVCTPGSPDEDVSARNNGRSLSECYFAGKGAALVLPTHERLSRPDRRAGCDIQQHLQSMFYLLQPEETLKMAVKLESAHTGRTRYLVVVSREGRAQHEESCLLGIDCSGSASTVGLVLRVLADTAITLDGDGGFSVSVCGRQHIFKPVSVQAMWSALQTLHKVSSKAREHNFFLGGLTHDWVEYYEQRIESDRSCLNEWHAMDNLESRRPPSPDSVRSKPSERDETERVIRSTLKEIMMSVDLDEVTSKYIRSRLEDQLDMDLTEFKSFIDQEMLTILGQMDAATEIFDHVYLGSEWNASNLEELQKNGVRHILNVTKEIDNFFPGYFNYLNIRVYDDEKTDLLKHWDNTYKYITSARKEGSKVLVHCKMGVSRSASVVIAYAMKAYNWDFKKALEFVQKKRSCIKPNTSFVSQLETYQGILDAMKNKEKLQRSKSETNLKSPGLVAKAEATSVGPNNRMLRSAPASSGASGVPSSTSVSSTTSSRTTDAIAVPLCNEPSGRELAYCGGRPKSWSPDNTLVSSLFTDRQPAGPTSVSLEHLNSDASVQAVTDKDGVSEPVGSVPGGNTVSTAPTSTSTAPVTRNYNANFRMPCANGLMYSVSPNKVVHLPGSSPNPSELSSSTSPASVKRRITQLETGGRVGLVECESAEEDPPPPAQTWDPGKGISDPQQDNTEPMDTTPSMPDSTSDTRILDISVKKPSDPFSNQVDRMFDREEKRQQRVSLGNLATPTITEGVQDNTRECPSRQSSWSSYDSAVVLREAPSRQSSWGSGDTRWGTLPSRNSSWGSYDMRPCAPSSEVAPCVSPHDREEVPWLSHTGAGTGSGTARRTRQRIEDVKQVCSDSDNPSTPVSSATTASLRLHTPRPYLAPTAILKNARSKSPRDSVIHYASSPALSSRGNSEDDVLNLLGSPPTDKIAVSQPNIPLFHSSVIPGESESCLSASAPASTSLSLVPGGRPVDKRCMSVDESISSSAPLDVPGKVKNLKKEFEAKSNAVTNVIPKEESRVRSLPSSPVSLHPEREPRDHHTPIHSPATSAEDLSVKVLVGKYEVGKVNSPVGPVNTTRTKRVGPEIELHRKSAQPPVPPRNSSFDVQNNSSSLRHNSLLVNNMRNGGSCVGNVGTLRGRLPPLPSIPPNVVVANVVAKAASKKQQQHGKTHPLSRLAISKVPRHTNPVYNTM